MPEYQVSTTVKLHVLVEAKDAEEAYRKAVTPEATDPPTDWDWDWLSDQPRRRDFTVELTD